MTSAITSTHVKLQHSCVGHAWTHCQCRYLMHYFDWDSYHETQMCLHCISREKRCLTPELSRYFQYRITLRLITWLKLQLLWWRHNSILEGLHGKHWTTDYMPKHPELWSYVAEGIFSPLAHMRAAHLSNVLSLHSWHGALVTLTYKHTRTNT